MDLAFSPEQEELVRILRQFARRELAPHSAAWDRSGQFPGEAWRRMGELGLLGLRVPAAHGGQESDFVTFGIAMEEIGRGDFACTYGLQLAGLAGEILGRSATEEVKARWLPPVARGEAVMALALTEPGAGSDAANLVCRAERAGGDYVLTGEKSGISAFLYQQQRYRHFENVYAGIVMIGMIGLITDQLLAFVGRYLFPWESGKTGLLRLLRTLLRRSPSATSAVTPSAG